MHKLLLASALVLALAACGGGGNNAGLTGSAAAPVQEPKIVFSRTIANKNSLFSIKADGTGSVPTLADNGDNNYFLGSSNNKRVIFGRSANGQNDIYSINRDGTGHKLMVAGIASIRGIAK